MIHFAEIEKAENLFRDMVCPWYVCGGWAIDIFLGRKTRPHKDIDFAIAREDQFILQSYLLNRGWILEKADEGKLSPWLEGEKIELPIHGIWCKNANRDPSFIEILLNEIDEKEFRFRRDESIRLPRHQMSFKMSRSLKVLSPEIVLLYKSGSPEENFADFTNAVNSLSPSSRAWLKASLRKLDPLHIWIFPL